MMKTGIAAYFGITTGGITPGFVKYHVVAFRPNPAEAIGIEDSRESLVGDRIKLSQVRAVAAARLAALR